MCWCTVGTRVVCAGGGLALASAQCPSCGGWWVEAGPHHQAGCGAGHCSSSPPPVSQLCQYLSWSIVNKYTNTSNSQPTLLTVIWETFPTSFILLFLLPALPSLVLLGVVAGSWLLVECYDHGHCYSCPRAARRARYGVCCHLTTAH